MSITVTTSVNVNFNINILSHDLAARMPCLKTKVISREILNFRQNKH